MPPGNFSKIESEGILEAKYHIANAHQFQEPKYLGIQDICYKHDMIWRTEGE